ncbi:MAG: twin-arginine translocation signal domain-containing protein, partial [Methylocystis sp.]
MIEKQDRRSFLKVAAATSAMGAFHPTDSLASPKIANVKLGDPTPFSFDLLKQQAQKLIKEPYRKPNIPAPQITSQIDYEEWGRITY